MGAGLLLSGCAPWASLHAFREAQLLFQLFSQGDDLNPDRNNEINVSNSFNDHSTAREEKQEVPQAVKTPVGLKQGLNCCDNIEGHKKRNCETIMNYFDRLDLSHLH